MNKKNIMVLLIGILLPTFYLHAGGADTISITREGKTVNDTINPTLRQEYLQAIQEAKEISQKKHESKKMIYTRLTFDINHKPFSPEVAKYAVENAGIDYKQNALLMSEEFAKRYRWSSREFRKQLNNEGFTAEEINYAMKNLKVSFKQNAYLRSAVCVEMGWSRAETYNFLRENGFTEKQALHAVTLRYK